MAVVCVVCRLKNKALDPLPTRCIPVLWLLLGMLVDDVLVEFPTNPLLLTVLVEFLKIWLATVRIITMVVHLVHHVLLLLRTNTNFIPMKEGLKFAIEE